MLGPNRVGCQNVSIYRISAIIAAYVAPISDVSIAIAVIFTIAIAIVIVVIIIIIIVVIIA